MKSKHDLKTISKEITILIRDKRLYHDINISRESIANMLGIPKALVSRVMREEMNTCFCDFVNKYRLKYACKILSSDLPKHKKLSLEDISLMSGFKCRMSLYRAYIKEFGEPPGKSRK